jgi:membrane-bound serine protease (ClpP class)
MLASLRSAALSLRSHIWGSAGAAILVFGGYLAAQTPSPAAAPAVPEVAGSEVAATGAAIYRVPLSGVVEMGLAPFIARSIREAEAAGAGALVLEIDTPGGRIDAAQQITDAISDASIPVYAFIDRRALSAGAMIALAADGIFMRPGSTLGAATPVSGEGEKASEKIVSVMRAEFRALAQARGLDANIAAAMVDEDIEIAGVVERGKLLTLSTNEATALGFATEVADWDALLAQLSMPQATVVTMEVNWAERVVRFLTHPIVAPFLLSIGFLGLIIEVKTPAFGLAGLTGISSLGLFFGSHLIIGLAGWEVVILLALGIILLLVEALVLPGFGVAGVLGGGAVAASIVMSMIGSLPTTTDILLALHVLGASVLIVFLVSWQLIRHLPHDRRAQNLWHRTSMTREDGYVSSTSRLDLLGTDGVTITDLRPSGTARFGGEQVDVVSIGPWVMAGTPVRVVRAEGYRHVVEPLTEIAAETGPGIEDPGAAAGD